MDWAEYFPSGCNVLALPNWQRPRLYLSDGEGALSRWQNSSLYPAFRTVAKGYRLMLRAKAAAGLIKSKTAWCNQWCVGEFVNGQVPAVGAIGVLIGTAGAKQKTTIQIRDKAGDVVAYLKYGETEKAKQSLANEHAVLCKLPPGAGPRALKFAPMGNGVALLMSPVPGAVAAATLPPPASIRPLLDSLRVGGEVDLNDHPWVRKFHLQCVPTYLAAKAWLDDLSKERWPIAINHGDFAPWNLILDEQQGGCAKAVDWEEGSMEGFAHVDLCHYLLQTAALVYRWSPRRTLKYAMKYLREEPWPNLGRHAHSLLRLTALKDYRHALELGIGPGERFQSWRKELWEMEVE